LHGTLIRLGHGWRLLVALHPCFSQGNWKKDRQESIMIVETIIFFAVIACVFAFFFAAASKATNRKA
jgi:hypothetical protein